MKTRKFLIFAALLPLLLLLLQELLLRRLLQELQPGSQGQCPCPRRCGSSVFRLLLQELPLQEPLPLLQVPLPLLPLLPVRLEL